MTEREDRAKKKDSLVVFNLPENVPADDDSGDDSGFVTTEVMVNEMANLLNIPTTAILSVHRHGRQNPDRPRITKVKFSAEAHAERSDFMKRAKSARALKPAWFSQVWCRPDLTSKQQRADFDLRKERNNLNDAGQGTGDYWFIRDGSLIKGTRTFASHVGGSPATGANAHPLGNDT